MQIRTGCAHTHHVEISLDADDAVRIEAPYREGKQVELRRINVSVKHDGEASTWSGRAVYVKQDGTAGQQLASLSYSHPLSLLPASLRESIAQQIAGARHA